jgi:hypothetical protein
MRVSAPKPICSWLYAAMACPRGMTSRNRYRMNATSADTVIEPLATR